MSIEHVERIVAQARALIEAHERRYPGLAFETEREREAIIGVHNATVEAFKSERTGRKAA